MESALVGIAAFLWVGACASILILLGYTDKDDEE